MTYAISNMSRIIRTSDTLGKSDLLERPKTERKQFIHQVEFRKQSCVSEKVSITLTTVKKQKN